MIWSEGSLMAPNSKNDDGYQFARRKSTWKPNFVPIGGFFYLGNHFGFKMAAIANKNGRDMVQYVLLPVNIHFHWNFLIFEFLTIFWIFILAPFRKFQDLNAPLEMEIHLPVKFSKDRIINLWEFGWTSSQREEEE